MRTMASIGATWAGARAARKTRPARTPMLVTLVTWLAGVLPSWPRVRTTVMQVVAFGFLDYAAWQLSIIAGCAAIGVSLLILEALGDSPKRGSR